MVRDLLHRMGYRAELENEFVTQDGVERKIYKHLAEANWVLANVGQCETELSRHNANVYMEIGVARHLEKPLYLFCPSSDAYEYLPAMLAGREMIRYDSAPDLLAQLYYKVALV
jgi:hypothetical protein